MQSFIYLFFMGIKVAQCVSIKTNEASYVQQIGQILQYVTN